MNKSILIIVGIILTVGLVIGGTFLIRNNRPDTKLLSQGSLVTWYRAKPSWIESHAPTFESQNYDIKGDQRTWFYSGLCISEGNKINIYIKDYLFNTKSDWYSIVLHEFCHGIDKKKINGWILLSASIQDESNIPSDFKDIYDVLVEFNKLVDKSYPNDENGHWKVLRDIGRDAGQDYIKHKTIKDKL